jgi:hypothetical protein
MIPFGVTIPAAVPQGLEIPEGLMNNPVQPQWVVTPGKQTNKQTLCLNAFPHV